MSLGPIRKNRTVWIDVGYFGSTFYAGFAPNEAAWKYDMARFKLGTPYPKSAGCATSFVEGEKTVIIITIDSTGDKTNGLNLTSLLLHESVHVFQRLCEHIGEDEKPSKEFEAYMIQHIYGDLADAFARTRVDPFRIKYKGYKGDNKP